MYERGILKRTFGTPQAFSTLEKKKEDIYWEETTFAIAEKVWSLEYVERNIGGGRVGLGRAMPDQKYGPEIIMMPF